jgi:transposase
MMMSPDDAMTEGHPVRRMEVFTGAGHRRTWSDEAKAQIVAESYSGVETVCAVARRYGLAPTQLFGWRRELRRMASPDELIFAPVVVEPVAPPAAESRTPIEPKAARRRSRRSQAGGIELEIDGVAVRVERGADAKTVAAIIRALKASR